MSEHELTWLSNHAHPVGTATARLTPSTPDLDEVFADAAAGSVLILERGEYPKGLEIEDDLTLAANGPPTSARITEGSGDALTINGGIVLVKGLLLGSEVEIGSGARVTFVNCSFKSPRLQCVNVNDATVEFINCWFAPSGEVVSGVDVRNGNVTLRHCFLRTTGSCVESYESEIVITNSVLRSPEAMHGVEASDSSVRLEDTVIAVKYEAVSATGGQRCVLERCVCESGTVRVEGELFARKIVATEVALGDHSRAVIRDSRLVPEHEHGDAITVGEETTARLERCHLQGCLEVKGELELSDCSGRFEVPRAELLATDLKVRGQD